MAKKIILAAAVIAFFGAIIAIGYLFFSLGGGTGSSPSNPNPKGSLPQTENQQVPRVGTTEESSPSPTIPAVFDKKIVAFHVATSGTVRAFEEIGTIWQIEKNNETKEIWKGEVKNLRSVRFSKGGEFVLVETGDSSKTEWSILDIQKSSWRPLGPGVESATWASSGSLLAYIAFKDGAGSLFSLEAKTTSSKPKIISNNLNLKEVSLNWQTPESLLIHEKPSAYALSSVWKYSLNKNTLEELVQSRFGLMGAWSESGEQGLITYGSEREEGGFSFLINKNGEAGQKLSRILIPSKCVFASEEILSTSTKKVGDPIVFCGIPRNQSDFEKAPLPDAYFMNKIIAQDDVYKINLKTGNSLLVLDASLSGIDITSPEIINKNLYFINKGSKKLHVISLESSFLGN